MNERTNERTRSIDRTLSRDVKREGCCRKTKRPDPVNANSLILCLENKNGETAGRGSASAVSHCENYRSSIPAVCTRIPRQSEGLRSRRDGRANDEYETYG